MKRYEALSLLLSILVLTATAQAGWIGKDPIPPYLVFPGSALAAGKGVIEDGTHRNSVWFLQDGLHWNDVFSRYDVDEDTWLAYPRPPFFPLDDNTQGTALVYCPNNNVLFAFKGEETREFWVYFPRTGSWIQGPPAPEAVGDGAALCYGGMRPNDHVFLYAFTGRHDEGPPGIYRGHFFCYQYGNTPTKGDNPPLEGTWQRLADIPGGRLAGHYPSLAWVPMNDDPHSYGLVVALKNSEGNQAIFYVYSPTENRWYERICLYDHRLDDGACMTSHFLNQTMFLFGKRHEREYGFYSVADNSVIIQSPTPQDVRKGASITAFQWEGIAYAEFGYNNPPPNFYQYIPPPIQEGNQGKMGQRNSTITVTVHPENSAHKFAVKSPPRAVQLSIMEVAGRKISSISTKSQNGNLDITWNHPIIPSGVYLWTITTASGGTNGKLVIAR